MWSQQILVSTECPAVNQRLASLSGRLLLLYRVQWMPNICGLQPDQAKLNILKASSLLTKFISQAIITVATSNLTECPTLSKIKLSLGNTYKHVMNSLQTVCFSPRLLEGFGPIHSYCYKFSKCYAFSDCSLLNLSFLL